MLPHKFKSQIRQSIVARLSSRPWYGYECLPRPRRGSQRQFTLNGCSAVVHLERL
jgi:hypothetical protein